MPRAFAGVAAVGALLLAGGCAIEPNSLPPARQLPPPAPAPPPVPVAVAPAADPLDGRPELAAPRPFEPPVPQVFPGPNGVTVWLFERHALPMVSVTVALPFGAAADPHDKPGLASITADMLDEGAGSRNAVELSTALNDLGASLGLGVSSDGTFASLTVLKKNFRPAFDLLADVVARPRFEDREWKRVSDLWRNALKKRADDPAAVSHVVADAVLYGPASPYGHPASGLAAGARNVDLKAVRAFYKAHYRPDRAVLVVAGDVTRDELTQEAASSLGGWTAPAEPPAPDTAGPLGIKPMAPRLILVDRPDAPQAVIAVVREGVAASDPRAPLLDLVNNALGGSFTSRLNQNLREDHGWTYGARSTFTEMRGPGAFTARAAVVTESTGPALGETLSELAKMAASGLTQDEFEKVRAQDRADLVQTYETVSGISRRLGSLAALGLPPTFDATASRARQQATLAQLGPLDAAVDPKNAVVIVVGPARTLAPQLAKLGLPAPELWDAEGFPLKTPKAPAAKGR